MLFLLQLLLFLLLLSQSQQLFRLVKYFFKPFIIEHLIERIVSAISAVEPAIRATSNLSA